VFLIHLCFWFVSFFVPERSKRARHNSTDAFFRATSFVSEQGDRIRRIFATGIFLDFTSSPNYSDHLSRKKFVVNLTKCVLGCIVGDF
jgi:hypothetical protein